jgi:hypothetical protein
MIEYKIKSQYEDTPRIAIHETEQPSFEVRLALNRSVSASEGGRDAGNGHGTRTGFGYRSQALSPI